MRERSLVVTLAVVASASLGCFGSDSGGRPAAKASPTPEVSIRALRGALIDQRSDKAAAILDAEPGLAVARDEEGDTALHMAAALDDVEVIPLLLAKGARVDQRNSDGDTPLHRAADNGQLRAARLLLDRGAPVDAPDAAGATALHRAKTAEVAELLCARGASLEVRTTKATTEQVPDPDNPGLHKPVELPAGSTPLAAARTLQREEVARVLEARGGRVPAEAAAGTPR